MEQKKYRGVWRARSAVEDADAVGETDVGRHVEMLVERLGMLLWWFGNALVG